jgi:hypothetical protein
MDIETKRVKLQNITPNPDNPRRINKIQMDRLVKSLREFPDMLSIREIVVDETMTVLGGNMRLLALRKIGAKEATAKIVKGLTEAQKREFIIKDNGAWGQWDFDLLANGWDDLPLADWGVPIPNFTDPNEEWKGMPEFGNEPKAFKTLYVHFETQDDVENFAEFIGQTIGEKTKYIWYPEKERQDLKGQSFENES